MANPFDPNAAKLRPAIPPFSTASAWICAAFAAKRWGSASGCPKRPAWCGCGSPMRLLRSIASPFNRSPSASRRARCTAKVAAAAATPTSWFRPMTAFEPTSTPISTSRSGRAQHPVATRENSKSTRARSTSRWWSTGNPSTWKKSRWSGSSTYRRRSRAPTTSPKSTAPHCSTSRRSITSCFGHTAPCWPPTSGQIDSRHGDVSSGTCAIGRSLSISRATRRSLPTFAAGSSCSRAAT